MLYATIVSLLVQVLTFSCSVLFGRLFFPLLYIYTRAAILSLWSISASASLFFPSRLSNSLSVAWFESAAAFLRRGSVTHFDWLPAQNSTALRRHGRRSRVIGQHWRQGMCGRSWRLSNAALCPKASLCLSFWSFSQALNDGNSKQPSLSRL